MCTSTQSTEGSSFERTNRHVTVRYRRTPPKSGRAFIATSSKSAAALVLTLSRDRIDLLLSDYIEPGTPVRIEMGDSGEVAYVDAVATITHSMQVGNGRWRSSAEWDRRLSDEQLLASRHCAFQGPHGF